MSINLKTTLKQITIITSILLTSCAGMHKAITGQGELTNTVSGFDDARFISVAPSMLVPIDSGLYSTSTFLGASWSSKYPNLIQLDLLHKSSIDFGNAYTNFKMISVNIEGEVTDFKTTGLTDHISSGYNSVSRDIYTESNGAITMTYSYFSKMLQSHDCKIRIHTSDGYEDAYFSYDPSEYSVEFASVALANLDREIQIYRDIKNN